MTNIFERASKQKLRFTTGKGLILVEDLWDLDLKTLDTMAIKVNKTLKESEDISFIKEKTVANTEYTLKLDILKHIIEYKLNLIELSKTRQEKAARLEQLKSVYVEKASEELRSMSKEELAKEIQALQG